jgi:hypothetical protein
MKAKLALVVSSLVLAIVPVAGHSVPIPEGVSGSGTFTGALVGGGFTVVYECTAAAVGAAASTHVDACVLKAPNGAILDSAKPRALPGNAAVVVKVKKGLTVVPQVCWTVSSTFIDNRTPRTSSCATSVGGSGGSLPKAGGGTSFGAA